MSGATFSFGIALLAVIFSIACDSPERNVSVPPAAVSSEQAPPAGAEISSDKNLYLVFDGSGSMGEGSCAGKFSNRVEAAKWAAKEFVTRYVAEGARMGLLVFDAGGAHERAALAKNNRALILAAVDGVRGGGGTPLNWAIKEATDVLVQQRVMQLGYGEFAIIVITDGQATDGDGGAREGVKYALGHQIPFHTLGYCLPKDHPLAADSLTYRTANSPEELLTGLQETQAEVPYFDSSTFPNQNK